MLNGTPTDGWKLSVEHWVDGCAALMDSMKTNGFLPQHPIPLDKNGELLNGTHRLACAIVLDIREIWVWRLENKEAWAPDWGVEWLVANGFPTEDIKRIAKDFEAICGRQAINEG